MQLKKLGVFYGIQIFQKTVDSNRTVSLYAVNAFHWFNIVVLLLSFPISIIVSKTVTISIVIVAVY